MIIIGKDTRAKWNKQESQTRDINQKVSIKIIAGLNIKMFKKYGTNHITKVFFSPHLTAKNYTHI